MERIFFDTIIEGRGRLARVGPFNLEEGGKNLISDKILPDFYSRYSLPRKERGGLFALPGKKMSIEYYEEEKKKNPRRGKEGFLKTTCR